MNFVHTVPLVAISVGLWINKEPVIGFIVNPIVQQTYSARVGKGAFLNGEPIKVSGAQGIKLPLRNSKKIEHLSLMIFFVTELSEALIGTEMGTSTDPKKLSVVLKNLTTFLGKCHG